MEKLNAKIDVYLKDPQDSLDLSGMKFGTEGAKRVAEVLPKWWVVQNCCGREEIFAMAVCPYDLKIASDDL